MTMGSASFPASENILRLYVEDWNKDRLRLDWADVTIGLVLECEEFNEEGNFSAVAQLQPIRRNHFAAQICC
jgi:hypothetical protein